MKNGRPAGNTGRPVFSKKGGRLKALVTADLHLGYRMYGLRQREQDFYKACDEVFDIARANKVDMVLLAGDVFDTSRPPAAAVGALSRCVHGSGILTIGIEGNHDKVGTGDWLSVCGVDAVGVKPLDAVHVTGIDYRRPQELISELESLAIACEDAGKKIPIVLLHCGFQNMGDPFAVDLPTSAVMPYLKRIGCHTVCVGHIHKKVVKTDVLEGHKVTFLQPGSIETCSLAEDYDKSVFVIEFDDSDLVSVREEKLHSRKFESVKIDTQDDLKKFLLSDMSAYKDKMTVVRVKSSIDGAIAAVDRKLSGELYRIVAYNDKIQLDEVDRSSQLITLESVIGEYFDEGTDVCELLKEILKNPESTAEVAERYMAGGKDAPVS